MYYILYNLFHDVQHEQIDIWSKYILIHFSLVITDYRRLFFIAYGAAQNNGEGNGK